MEMIYEIAAFLVLGLTALCLIINVKDIVRKHLDDVGRRSRP